MFTRLHLIVVMQTYKIIVFSVVFDARNKHRGRGRSSVLRPVRGGWVELRNSAS